VPLYVYSGWSLWQGLLAQRRTPLLWALGFLGACAAALLPAWLLEPRCGCCTASCAWQPWL
jgi:hypothetical protein